MPFGWFCIDWEAIADRESNVMLSSECLPGVSNLSLEDSKVEARKRRGRGPFSYRKSELYSDRLSDMSAFKDTENEDVRENPEKKKAECKLLSLSIQGFVSMNAVHMHMCDCMMDQVYYF